jgi:2-methylisocitrate lyase-like PEP mutase family enzyme
VEGLDAAIARANLYGATGADVCFIEAPQGVDELKRIPHEVRYPLLVNMLAGGVTPILPVEELDRLGYKIVVCPIETLLVAGTAIQRLIQALLTRGRVDLPAAEMMTFAQVKEVLGLDDVLGLRGKLERSL